MAIKTRVLFLCTENSCRTQMAEGFLRELAGEDFEIVSAGSEAGRLDPDAVAAMREVGIDISPAQTKVVDPYLRQRFHYVITLCDREKERTCPVFPGAIWRQKWPIDSPAALEAMGLDRSFAVRRVRDEIRRYVVEFVEKHQHPSVEKGKSAWN
ncbi:MAG TPA: arsenate reductase ArsC [Bryobacteraceae bacterium]|nr:arsenate reductase ArsC [Bryobacteraceae bacterium]